uniref:Cilia- and flagella-associated protein 43 n=1 Tax=Loxodonta africana TaxID=9785 RepID=G3TZZ3_LOXAF
VATNIPCEVVAFSDRRLKPLIYIYNFPGMTRRTKLKGNILLDYTLLTFSHCGTYLASYSTLPEYELALWFWVSQVLLLCSLQQPRLSVSMLSLSMSLEAQKTLSPSLVVKWVMSLSDPGQGRQRSVKLPAEDGSIVDETDIIFTHSLLKDPIYGPVLPLSAIAGLVGEEAELQDPKDDLCPLLHPTMHCWTPSSDLYVGCEEGHLLMINGDTLKVTVLNKTEEPPPLEDRRNIITPITLAYQKEGVLASGIDGFVYSFLIKDSSYKVQDFTEVEEPVEHLTFSPNYKMLLIQTEKGSTYIYTFGEEPTLDKILASCDGNFQAIDFITPGNSHFMTLTGSGDVGIWLLDDGSPVSRISLNTLSTVLACCPSSPSAAVGTVGGSVHFLDVADVNSPREVHKAFLSKASVQDVIYDQRGMYLLAGTSEGYIFVINAKPSSSFQILGYTEVGKGVLQISTVSLLETDIVEVMVLTPLPKTDRSRLEIFTLPLILPQVAAAFADERGKLRDEFIHRYLYEIEHALSSAVLDFQSQRIFGFCSHVPYICSYLLPKKEHTGICILKPFQKVQSKHYGYGKLYLSSHGLWLLTAAKGGILYIRDAYTLEMFARCRSHSYQAQGIRSLKASMDGQDILVNGRNDGTLVCLKWKRFGGVLATESLDHCLKLLTSLNTTMNEESAYIRGMRRDSLDLGSDNEKTGQKANIDSSQEELVSAQDMKEISWMEAKGQEAIKKEVNQFSKKRREIKKGIKALAKTVQSMMEENETVGHIAKLEQQELSLDLEELQRLHDESEEEVAKIRKDAEMDNLAKRYLAELIKEECWNSMAVKGRALKCFHIPYTVENFPMKERTAEEMKELEKVLQQKKIETECLKILF